MVWVKHNVFQFFSFLTNISPLQHNCEMIVYDSQSVNLLKKKLQKNLLSGPHCQTWWERKAIHATLWFTRNIGRPEKLWRPPIREPILKTSTAHTNLLVSPLRTSKQFFDLLNLSEHLFSLKSWSFKTPFIKFVQFRRYLSTTVIQWTKTKTRSI